MNNCLIWQAYESLSDGLGRTTSAIIRSPIKTYQRGSGAGSALVTAVRGAPVAAVAPASAAVQALHCALLGLRNTYINLLSFPLLYKIYFTYRQVILILKDLRLYMADSIQSIRKNPSTSIRVEVALLNTINTPLGKY